MSGSATFRPCSTVARPITWSSTTWSRLLRWHRRLYGALSPGPDRCQHGRLPHDGQLLWHRLPRAQDGRQRGRRARPGRPQPDVCRRPNVHWPEVLFSYEATDKVLFSADGFGKFGANDIEDPEGWACEARRYYFGIVGKFGKFVQAVLKKAAEFGHPDHLPAPWPRVDREPGLLPRHLQHLVELPARGRGHHHCLCERVRPSEGCRRGARVSALEARGEKVSVFDLARDDMAEAVEDAFRYDRLVLASITYQGESSRS